MSGHPRLEHLFTRCDTKGTGRIDRAAFRELCADFGIDADDADVIFTDLDHDGDGEINFADFSHGFRDFLTPGARRGSVQLGLSTDSDAGGSTPPNQPHSLRTRVVEEHLPGMVAASLTRSKKAAKGSPPLRFDTIEEVQEKQKVMEQRHNAAKAAWKHLADNMGQDDVKKFLQSSGDKLLTLYEELQSSEANPQLVSQFEDLISSIVSDVKKIEDNNRRMEERIVRERETHTAHLKNMEAELDAHVARIEKQAQEKAKLEFETDKRELQSRLESELAELRAQLKLFQKVDSWINKEKGETHSAEAQKRFDEAFDENRRLKSSLMDTQTNIAILRTELNQMRSQYDTKCSELSIERENKMEYVYEFDNMNRQLDLLKDANQKLQDTNDGLRQIVDVSDVRSPRNARNARKSSRSSPLSADLDEDSAPMNVLMRQRSTLGNSRPRYARYSSRSPSDCGGYEESPDSLTSDRSKATDVNYGLRRLIDDLDSGHSTLPCDDCGPYDLLSTPDDSETQGAGLIEGISRSGSAPAMSSSVVARGKLAEQHQLPDQRTRANLALNLDSGGQQVATDEAVLRKISAGQHPAPPPVPAPRKSLAKRPTSQVSAKSLSFDELEPTGPPDRTYKVVFAGDAAVGKTSFINRLTKGRFVEHLSSTLGVDFQVKTFRVDERNIALQLWDTAGQERFRSVTRSYFRRADGVMLLYDVTNEASFKSVRSWVESIDEVSEKRIPIMLCGNKTDMRTKSLVQNHQQSVVVPFEAGERMASTEQAIFLETSTKDGSNVIEALVQLSRVMCANEDTEVQTSALQLRETPAGTGQGKKSSCCSGRSQSSIRRP